MLTRWDGPRQSLAEEFRRRLSHLLEEYEGGREAPRGGRSVEGEPRFNLFDTGEKLILRGEVPGLREEGLTITAQQEVLTIQGERAIGAPEGYSVHRRERLPYRFSRSFSLPVPLEVDQITAKLRDGMLTVHLPKRAEEKPKEITIKVS